MRKLSETPIKSSSQVLVLFDEILDGYKLLQSPEILALVKHFYGKVELSLVKIMDNSEKLHDRLREAQYRADVQGGAMVYPFKAPFEEMTLATHSDQFSGPLYVQVFTSEKAVFDVLTITCRWNDGLFSNDYYVVGAIVDADDFGKISKQ